MSNWQQHMPIFSTSQLLFVPLWRFLFEYPAVKQMSTQRACFGIRRSTWTPSLFDFVSRARGSVGAIGIYCLGGEWHADVTLSDILPSRCAAGSKVCLFFFFPLKIKNQASHGNIFLVSASAIKRIHAMQMWWKWSSAWNYLMSECLHTRACPDCLRPYLSPSLTPAEFRPSPIWGLWYKLGFGIQCQDHCESMNPLAGTLVGWFEREISSRVPGVEDGTRCTRSGE